MTGLLQLAGRYLSSVHRDVILTRYISTYKLTDCVLFITNDRAVDKILSLSLHFKVQSRFKVLRNCSSISLALENGSLDLGLAYRS